MNIKKVAIIGYNRIPFAKNNTAYITRTNQDLLLAALNGLVERYDLTGKLIDEVTLFPF
ncbi:hypothetical protein [Chryseobacterium ginsenosidimutans]|uniref:hypothetical protein n=1 Tax=Chryseobacterium ginsenosidimutans TaxID=687846 RepID=UPI0031E08FFD